MPTLPESWERIADSVEAMQITIDNMETTFEGLVSTMVEMETMIEDSALQLLTIAQGNQDSWLRMANAQEASVRTASMYSHPHAVAVGGLKGNR